MVTARHPLLSLVLAVSLALPVAACAAPSSSHPVPDVGNAVSPVPGVVSSGRLDASDVATLQANGFRQVIDLTPDDETPGFDEAGLVREAGMAYANLPIRGPADLNRANVAAFDALLRDIDAPVLVHCASGNRVGAMAALRAAWVEGHTVEKAVEIGRAWGMKGLESAVRERLASEPGAG